MALVYIGLGTNLGNRERNLNDTILNLAMEVGMIIRQSGMYQFKPWGFSSEHYFLNTVVLVETLLSPFDLLAKTQEIERKSGRTEKTSTVYTDRLMDIDILFYDNLIIHQPTLKIPHPLMGKRDFVLMPLSEIAPELVHPVSGKKIKEMWNELLENGVD
jgi:2-amino-4-hydroxy-6-hydroxymethyldihydropteridine diphosphokinase